ESARASCCLRFNQNAPGGPVVAVTPPITSHSSNSSRSAPKGVLGPGCSLVPALCLLHCIARVILKARGGFAIISAHIFYETSSRASSITSASRSYGPGSNTLGRILPTSPYFVPYAGRFDGFHATPASVSKTCLVRLDNNKYSVAAKAVGRPVEI